MALIDNGSNRRWADTALGEGRLPAASWSWQRSPTSLAEWKGPVWPPKRWRTSRGKVLRLGPELFAFAPCAERVWALGDDPTLCDAWYVVVAEASGSPLMTLDRRLVRASGLACDTVISSSD